MAICALWLIYAYPGYQLAQRSGQLDWLLGIMVITAIFTVTISFISPRNRWRQRALAAVYTIGLLRMAQSFLSVAKHDPASITVARMGIWLLVGGLMFCGILNLLAGSLAHKYFRD